MNGLDGLSSFESELFRIGLPRGNDMDSNKRSRSVNPADNAHQWIKGKLKPVIWIVAVVALIVIIPRITASQNGVNDDSQVIPTTRPRPSLAIPGAPASSMSPYPPVITLPPLPTVKNLLPSRPPIATLPPSLSLEPFEIPEEIMAFSNADSAIKILSVTSPVAPDAYATVDARGTPGVEYDISVIYYSGPSKASGLFPKTADSGGMVSWTWHIGPKTKAGDWEIIISGGGDKTSTYFTVAD
jgi:hypothetical protein